MIRIRPTIEWGRTPAKPTILGLTLSAALLGCETQTNSPMGMKTSFTETQRGPAPAPPPVVTSERPHPAVEAAKVELGPEAAEAIADMPRTKPSPPVEAGAKAILADMMNAAPALASSSGEDATVVGLARMRNQSRASPVEFAAFIERFATLLSAAGAEQNIRFVAQSETPADYELLGAAYLITAQGLDQWELFLRLSPAEDAWTIWQSAGGIRVIRQPRPGTSQPQILRWPQPLDKP